MANHIPPKAACKAIDPFSRLDGEPTPGQAALLSLSNLAGCIAGEHFRTFGFRGYHSVATIAVAATSINHLYPGKLSYSEAVGLIEPEREAWPEDLSGEAQWRTALALLRMVAPPKGDDGVPMSEAVGLPGFMQMSSIMAAYIAVPRMLAPSMVSGAAVSDSIMQPVLAAAFGGLPPVLEHFMHARNFGMLASAATLRAHQTGQRRISFSSAWSLSRKPYGIPPVEVTVGAQAPPEVVKARRLERGMQGVAHLLAEKSKELRGLADAEGSPFRKAFRHYGMESLLRGDLSQVYCSTFMRPDDYQKFLTTGVYQDVWARGPTWHTRYGDRPLIGRAHSEMRAFGERGDGITYGYLTTCDEWQDEVSRVGAGQYGGVEIYWNPARVLPMATATLEDAMRSPFLVDAANPLALAFLTFLVFQSAAWARNDPALRQFASRMPGLPGSGRYIEFQCHGPLTPDDIESVVVHGEGAGDE